MRLYRFMKNIRTNPEIKVNADKMSVEQIHRKLEKGYADIEKGNIEDTVSVFAAFREKY